jgi:hypothetical protein
MPKLPIYTVNNNIHPKLPPQTNQIQNPTSTQKKKKRKNKITRTVTLWVSGMGWASSGLITLYFPTVMELVFMSSAMHLV